MGNSQKPASQSWEHEPQSRDLCHNENRSDALLKSCFLALTGNDGSDHIRSGVIKNKLIPECPQFADHLASTEGFVNQADFLTFGNQLIHSSYDPSQQQRIFVRLFSEETGELNKNGASEMLSCCQLVAWLQAGFPLEGTSNQDESLQAVLRSMFGQDENLGVEDVCYWINRHIPRLFMPLHQYLTQRFLGNKINTEIPEENASALPNLLVCLRDGRSKLNFSYLWGLSSSLPSLYIPSSSHQTQGVLSGPSLPLADIVNDGWVLLYSSNDQGLSINRFLHHVIDYKGPTVTLLGFQNNCFCIASDEEWRESRQRWGGPHCTLVQLSPEFKIVMAGASMLYMNIQDRSVPKGIQVGKDARTLLLEIDEGLSKMKYYGIEYDLHAVEVWGCGGSAVRDAQMSQKKWEHQQALKSKERKLKLEDWKDNPDKELLNMGGVTTEHAQR